jgi:hypothetical protein
MIVLPRAEVAELERLFLNLPGIDGAKARLSYLRLVWPDALNSKFPPELSIESGWKDVVAVLAQPPFAEAVDRLERLLASMATFFQAGDTAAAIEAVRLQISGLRSERSMRTFLARLGIDPEDESSMALAVLDRVFVPPRQFDAALEILESEHLLVLCGDPHMGKTYTALRILWEHFRDHGREPFWRRAASGSSDANPKLDNLIVDGATIYVEDPLGRTMPLDNADDVSHSLRRLLTSAKPRDVRVVATSRTSVLRVALPQNLQRCIVELSRELLLEHAYDNGALVRIAQGYLDLYQPRWLADGQRDASARWIAANLRAPHNIQEFVAGTRQAADARTVLARVDMFRDIVQQYANVFEQLDHWVLCALIVVAMTSEQEVPRSKVAWLHEQMLGCRHKLQTFDAALRSLRDYVATVPSDHDAQRPVPRHPSVEDAVKVLCQREEHLVEANWALVVACRLDGATDLDGVALRVLLTYADRWAESPGRLDLLQTYFSGKRIEVREASRRAVLYHLADLSAEATTVIAALATQSWGDRMLLRFYVNIGSMADEPRWSLARRLCTSRDSQTRHAMADLIGRIPAGVVQKRLCAALIEDSDPLVRRLALLRTLQQPACDATLQVRVQQAIASLTGRHRRWLDLMAVTLPPEVTSSFPAS